MRMFPNAAIVLSVLALALPASAQSDRPLPAPQSVAGVKYVQGGIGRDEADAILREARNYPLSVVFSGGTDNHFVADVDIRVRDASGKTVLQTTAKGPIVLIELPAGRYVVDAGYRGKDLQKRTELSAGRATRLDFHWKEAD